MEDRFIHVPENGTDRVTQKVDIEDWLGAYLRSIDCYARITPEEETRLLAVVVRGREAAQESEANGKLRPLIDYSEELDERIAAARDARRTLIEANLSLSVSVAFRLAKIYEIPFNDSFILDLINEGNIGLMEAIDRYDPAKGKKGKRLSTYASYWIFKREMEAIERCYYTLSINDRPKETAKVYEDTASKMRRDLGREPFLGEVISAMRIDRPGLNGQQLDLIRQALQPAISLDRSFSDSESDPDTSASIFPDPMFPDPVLAAEGEDLRQIIKSLLAGLPPRESQVLNLLFGLEDGRPLSIKEVVRRLNMPHSTIFYFRALALERLRDPSCARKLRDYY